MKPRSGRPTEVHCEQLEQIIDQDRNIFNTNYCVRADFSAKKTIVNALKRINVTLLNRWVPDELTDEGKRKRKAACLALLRDQRKEKILTEL
ncbi:hypothetical protein AVEN_10865-1 [Araneus ventricosus]|uniref:Uncharacterized protein n=1 Tax=Araneus ventricosus TaxID=182803 RepID=A0A4Y2RW40_ARAVE|nr:hypothetical protein AVEN_10865-1 [Araneus ventricosus]